MGTFANYYREPKVPTERDTEVIAMIAQTTALAIERHQRELERKRAEEQRDLLLRELDHRVKNLFAVASAIVKMSGRSATSVPEVVNAISGRLDALHRAHERAVSDRTKDCSLKDIVSDVLAPYADGQRLQLSGDDLNITDEAVRGIALILHELATNAAKYGALS